MLGKEISLSFVLCFLITSNCLDNGLGLTPPMGWNSWNHFGCNISESLIKQTADLLVSSGLADKGYKYLNLDDCWQISRDLYTSEIVQDKSKFPSGMAHLVEYVHSKGLKFGLYSDAGTRTCQGRPGSYGFEQIDASTYAKWGVDYLKFDNCHNEGLSPRYRYPLMRDALNKTGRPVYFSMCEWGFDKPHQWAQVVANSWRTTSDIKDIWLSFMYILGRQKGLSKYAGPGHWNDPDMLEVGNGGMNHEEYQSHFSLWAALKAPLLIGCSLKNMKDETYKILTNQQIIAINQDPLGRQADIIHREIYEIGWKQTWGGELSGNRFVIVFLNTAQTSTVFHFKLSHSEFGGRKVIGIRDVIDHTDITIPTGDTFVSKIVKKRGVANYIFSLSSK